MRDSLGSPGVPKSSCKCPKAWSVCGDFSELPRWFCSEAKVGKKGWNRAKNCVWRNIGRSYGWMGCVGRFVSWWWNSGAASYSKESRVRGRRKVWFWLQSTNGTPSRPVQQVVREDWATAAGHQPVAWMQADGIEPMNVGELTVWGCQQLQVGQWRHPRTQETDSRRIRKHWLYNHCSYQWKEKKECAFIEHLPI